MMAYLGCFLRPLFIFLVVDIANLYICSAAGIRTLPQSQTNLFAYHERHQQKRESPTNSMSKITSNLRFWEKTPRNQRSTSDQVANSISYSVLRFGLEVGSKLSENAYYSKSEVFSPLSIMTALSLLLAGSRGKTYQQLRPIFGFDIDAELQRLPNYGELLHQEFGNLLEDIEQNDFKALHHSDNAKWRDTPIVYNIRGASQKQNELIDHVIKVANGLFAQTGYNVNPVYRDVISQIYRSELSQLDYHTNPEAARQYINAWVSKNTYGKIPNIISNAIPQSTNMILASVLYFKGFWENTFFEAATSLDNFYPEGQTKPAIKVKMMFTGGVFPYYDALEHNCHIIGLPYKGNLSTMYVIQPKDSSRANLKNFQSKISVESIDDMISKMAYRTAVVAFPKMHIERQLNMKEILKNFGISDIFSSTSSDLSLIGGISAKNIPPVIRTPLPLQNVQINSPQFMDRFNEAPLYFKSRFGEIGNDTKIHSTADNTTENKINETLKTTMNENKNSRRKRQTLINTNPISLLEAERLVSSTLKSDLYVEDILHKVDFEVNEHGTEAAAATLTYLRRSGTDVIFRADTPFILLIRHDPSKLILFYGIINEPES